MIAELSNLNIISFLLIFFIGLPHGSFDGAVASLVGFNTKIEFKNFIFYIFLFFSSNFFLVINFQYCLFDIYYYDNISLLDYVIGLTSKSKKYKFSVSFAYAMTIIFGIIFFNEESIVS